MKKAFQLFILALLGVALTSGAAFARHSRPTVKAAVCCGLPPPVCAPGDPTCQPSAQRK